MQLDIESCGGDGISGGEYSRAILLGRLVEFLSDSINLTRAQTGMLSAPEEDRRLLDEAFANLREGFDPGNEAVEAILQYTGIFCGQITYRGGKVEVDVGFVGDDEV